VSYGTHYVTLTISGRPCAEVSEHRRVVPPCPALGGKQRPWPCLASVRPPLMCQGTNRNTAPPMATDRNLRRPCPFLTPRISFVIRSTVGHRWADMRCAHACPEPRPRPTASQAVARGALPPCAGGKILPPGSATRPEGNNLCHSSSRRARFSGIRRSGDSPCKQNAACLLGLDDQARRAKRSPDLAFPCRSSWAAFSHGVPNRVGGLEGDDRVPPPVAG